MTETNKMTYEEARNLLEELNPEALLADGFEDALIGVATIFTNPPLAAYDYDECVAILMERDGMSWEDACEFMEINVVGAFVGGGTPVFVRTCQTRVVPS
jgi:hypothetical protein